MDEKELRGMIERGLSIRQMMAETGKSNGGVRHWLRKFGLKTKNNPFNRGAGTPECNVCGQTDPARFSTRLRVCMNCDCTRVCELYRGRKREAVEY